MSKTIIYWNDSDDFQLFLSVNYSIKNHSFIKWKAIGKEFENLYSKGVIQNEYTKSQCLKRWYNYLKLKCRTWNPIGEDDKLLLLLTYQFQLNWDEICLYGNGKTKDEMFNRYEEIYKDKMFLLFSQVNDRIVIQTVNKKNLTKLISSVHYLDLNLEMVKNIFCGESDSKEIEKSTFDISIIK